MALKWKRILATGAILIGCSLFVGSLFRIVSPETVVWGHYALGAALGGIALIILMVITWVIGPLEMPQKFPPGYLRLFKLGIVCFPVGILAFVLIAHGFKNIGFPLGIVAVASGIVVVFIMWLTLMWSVLRKAWK